jgi:uncharacterized damage-inducible protein DinB
MNSEQAAALRDFLVASFENEAKITRKVIGSVPEDQHDYKPDPNARTAFDLALHVAQSDIYFLNGVASSNFPDRVEKPPEIKTVADIVVWYDKNLSESLARVRGLSAEKLTQPINFHGLFNLPAVQYLMVGNNHRIHHRGQLATYLRPMGAKVPRIYGGSFDEPMQRAAQT